MADFIPSKFYLSQNAPNPFSKETKIKYCLPVKSKVHIAILNSERDIIKLLVNKTQEAGTYEIKYKNLHSLKGEYYYRIKARQYANGYSQIFNQYKKMIVF